MIGLKFVWSFIHPEILKNILDLVHGVDFYWNISGEVIEKDKESKFPNSLRCTGNHFYDLACSSSLRYVYRFHAEAFSTPSVFDPLTTFEAYLNSSCELIILIDDATIVHVYSKQTDNIQYIYDKLPSYGIEDIVILSQPDNRF